MDRVKFPLTIEETIDKVLNGSKISYDFRKKPIYRIGEETVRTDAVDKILYGIRRGGLSFSPEIEQENWHSGVIYVKSIVKR